ncbi:2,3-diaminopropionate biosynthesis protein SbnB [Zooshikella sp. RANM57]|uniref:2,3-diaminopropionate biosynthesis protein SbnB n=1 Tax=Zooshikella sp. RANM57 TaxID=3425863 RepID=UPI003D6F225E
MNTVPKFQVISGEVVNSLLTQDYESLANIIEKTYLDHGQGLTINPDSYFLRFKHKPNARIIALPSYIDPINVSGIKWISSFPDNIQNGVPRASAVLILNDGNTGYPLACIEASIISAMRTAVSAVIGAYHLRNKNKKVGTLGIVGNGLIAKYVVSVLHGLHWEIDQINVYDQNTDYSCQFSESVGNKTGYAFNISSGLDDCLQNSEVILLTTTAAQPYIHDLSLLQHNPLILNLSLRDLGEEVILNSYNVLDDVDHCLKANTSPHLAEMKVGNRGFIDATLPEILNGTKKISDNKKPVVFSPFGLGVLDLAMGHYIYQQAIEQGSSVEIDNFFYDLSRN